MYGYECLDAPVDLFHLIRTNHRYGDACILQGVCERDTKDALHRHAIAGKARVGPDLGFPPSLCLSLGLLLLLCELAPPLFEGLLGSGLLLGVL